nr:MAG TPA: hypothetical protein [Caudoviricetes sp.]
MGLHMIPYIIIVITILSIKNLKQHINSVYKV